MTSTHMLASSSNDDGENRSHGLPFRPVADDGNKALRYTSFFANVIMCYRVAPTEALLCGIRLRKQVNPIITLGSVLVPILFSCPVLIARGFDDELDRGVTGPSNRVESSLQILFAGCRALFRRWTQRSIFSPDGVLGEFLAVATSPLQRSGSPNQPFGFCLLQQWVGMRSESGISKGKGPPLAAYELVFISWIGIINSSTRARAYRTMDAWKQEAAGITKKWRKLSRTRQQTDMIRISLTQEENYRSMMRRARMSTGM